MTEPNQKQESLPGPDEQASPSPPAGAAADNGQSFPRQFERFANGFEIAMTKIESRLNSIDAKIESVKNELNGKIESGNRELKGEIKRLDDKIESVKSELNGKIESVKSELKVEIKSNDIKIESLSRELQGLSRELQGFGKRLDGFNLPIVLVASFLVCLLGVVLAAFKPWS